MALSKRSIRGIAAFQTIQRGWKNIKYMVPQLTDHEKALKMNDRLDVEKAQKEKRNGR